MKYNKMTPGQQDVMNLRFSSGKLRPRHQESMRSFQAEALGISHGRSSGHRVSNVSGSGRGILSRASAGHFTSSRSTSSRGVSSTGSPSVTVTPVTSSQSLFDDNDSEGSHCELQCHSLGSDAKMSWICPIEEPNLTITLTNQDDVSTIMGSRSGNSKKVSADWTTYHTSSDRDIFSSTSKKSRHQHKPAKPSPSQPKTEAELQWEWGDSELGLCGPETGSPSCMIVDVDACRKSRAIVDVVLDDIPDDCFARLPWRHILAALLMVGIVVTAFYLGYKTGKTSESTLPETFSDHRRLTNLEDLLSQETSLPSSY